jgi:hypothetical protein
MDCPLGKLESIPGQFETDRVKAGDTIRLRYDFGMDSCNSLDGWYVDDINIQVPLS